MRRSFALKVGVKNAKGLVVLGGSCFKPLVAPVAPVAPEKPVLSIPEGLSRCQ
jgi:hypothetical protein